MSEAKKFIAELVKELQEKKGVTLEQVYDSIQMGKGTFFNRMRENNFRPHEAAALAKYFEVDYESCFGGYYDTKAVLGEPRFEYQVSKDELIEAYRKIDKLHEELEHCLKREIKLVKVMASKGVLIPD